MFVCLLGEEGKTNFHSHYKIYHDREDIKIYAAFFVRETERNFDIAKLFLSR